MLPYKYTPLDVSSDEIRLVTILPGKFRDPIRIEITHVPLVPPVQGGKAERLSVKEIQRTVPESWEVYETLEGRILFYDGYEGTTTWNHPDPNLAHTVSAPLNEEKGRSQLSYEALSYVWGPPKGRIKAIVQKPDEVRGWRAKLRTRRLPITSNLTSALRYLRYEDRERVMWIDAICINQADLDERSVQVRRMAQIYSFASRVVAWIGSDYLDSELAFSLLGRLGRQCEMTRANELLASPDGDTPDWSQAPVALPWDTAEWDAIYDVYSRDWFERLWVVQEIKLGSISSVLKCGDDELPWSVFRRATLCINNKQHDTIRWQIIRAPYHLCIDTGDSSFEEILVDNHDRLCYDPRDKVYGLMNLAAPEITSHLSVNYADPLVEVFKQVLLACTEREKRLVQLTYSGRRYAPSTSPGWPTWVPNWSQPTRNTVPRNQSFCASGVSASQARYISPDRLEVTALHFSTVFSDPDQVSPLFGTGRRMRFGQPNNPIYPTGERYATTWLQTLTMGNHKDRYPDRNIPSLVELWEAVSTSADRTKVAPEDLPRNYYESLNNAMSGLYLFSLQNQYMGLVYGMPQQGETRKTHIAHTWTYE